MAINKVVYGSDILIDLTSDTATASDVASGKTFHLADGTQATGTASSPTVAIASVTNSSNTATSLSFTVSGEPKAWAVINTGNITLSSGYYYITAVHGGDNQTTRGAYGYYKSGSGSSRYIYANGTYYTGTYSNGTFTVTSSGSRSSAGGSFYNTTYQLIYVY